MPLGHPTGRDLQPLWVQPHTMWVDSRSQGPGLPSQRRHRSPSRLCHHSSRDIRPISFFSLDVSLASYTLEGQRTPPVLRVSLASGVRGHCTEGTHIHLPAGLESGKCQSCGDKSKPGRLEAMGRWAQTVSLSHSGGTAVCLHCPCCPITHPECRRMVLLSPALWTWEPPRDPSLEPASVHRTVSVASLMASDATHSSTYSPHQATQPHVATPPLPATQPCPSPCSDHCIRGAILDSFQPPKSVSTPFCKPHPARLLVPAAIWTLFVSVVVSACLLRSVISSLCPQRLERSPHPRRRPQKTPGRGRIGEAGPAMRLATGSQL